MSTTSSESAVAGGSASAVYAETDTGWHVLKVEGYSKLKGIGVGRRVKSGAFTVGGHRWCITFFPDGSKDETADWICVSLYLEDQLPTDGFVNVRFTLSLLDQAGEPVPAYSISSDMLTISSTDSIPGRGYQEFIKSKHLESSFLKDDSFQIRCDVTVLHLIRTTVIPMESLALFGEAYKRLFFSTSAVLSSLKKSALLQHFQLFSSSPNRAPSPPPATSDLQRHLGDLFASEVGGDVTFEVNGELFTAHRCLLAARSSVFMAELFAPMKEKEAQRVRIQDMEVRVFKIMLQFIYTDSLPEIEADERTVIAQHLLVAADRYNLQRLKLICEEMLCSSVDIGTAATTLVLAEEHACQGLKAACFEFLRRPGNLKAVMASDGFQHLKSSCPTLLQEMMLAMFAP